MTKYPVFTFLSEQAIFFTAHLQRNQTSLRSLTANSDMPFAAMATIWLCLEERNQGDKDENEDLFSRQI